MKFKISCIGRIFSSAVAKLTFFVLQMCMSAYFTLYNSTPPFTQTLSAPPAGTKTSKLIYLPVNSSFTVAPLALGIGFVNIPLSINTSPIISGSNISPLIEKFPITSPKNLYFLSL